LQRRGAVRQRLGRRRRGLRHDYYYDDDKPLGLLEQDFLGFFRALLKKEGLL
jgi:hypothetical protein